MSCHTYFMASPWTLPHVQGVWLARLFQNLWQANCFHEQELFPAAGKTTTTRKLPDTLPSSIPSVLSDDLLGEFVLHSLMVLVSGQSMWATINLCFWASNGFMLIGVSDCAPPHLIGINWDSVFVLQGEAAAPLFLGFRGHLQACTRPTRTELDVIIIFCRQWIHPYLTPYLTIHNSHHLQCWAWLWLKKDWLLRSLNVWMNMTWILE